MDIGYGFNGIRDMVSMGYGCGFIGIWDVVSFGSLGWVVVSLN